MAGLAVSSSALQSFTPVRNVDASDAVRWPVSESRRLEGRIVWHGSVVVDVPTRSGELGPDLSLVSVQTIINFDANIANAGRKSLRERKLSLSQTPAPAIFHSQPWGDLPKVTR